jgi:hypothetical protein
MTIESIETKSEDTKFNYMLLSRLKMDCDYYLGNGQIYGSHLWAGDERKQIDKMRELWNGFKKKPAWLSMDDIETYESKMIK